MFTSLGWRTVLLGLIFAGSALYIYYEQKMTKSSPDAVATEKSPTHLKKNSTASSPSERKLEPSNVNRTNEPLRKTPSAFATTSEKSANRVPFQIDEHGFAIAFGDIILGVPSQEIPDGQGYAAAPKVMLWESREIPFHIQADFPNPERVYAALELFRDTPILFVPYEGQPDAIVFEGREGHCKSYLGRVGGLQPIWLSDNCYPQQIAHEIMHALGFIHEHSRIDRDRYVEIVWDNIQEEYKNQFAVVPSQLMISVDGTPFDYKSIMIYPERSFSKTENSVTIRSRDNSTIAPSEGLSENDKLRLHSIYGKK